MAERHHPAAVVMDIYMPEMDGIEATRRLRAAPDLRPIPIVAHTESRKARKQKPG